MHEFGIVQTIVEIVTKSAKEKSIEHVKNVHMDIGRMAGFDPEQLSFLFQNYNKEDALKDAKFIVNEIDVELKCSKCKHTYIDERFHDRNYAHRISHAPMSYESPNCPKCNNNSVKIVRGKELTLVRLED